MHTWIQSRSLLLYADFEAVALIHHAGPRVAVSDDANRAVRSLPLRRLRLRSITQATTLLAVLPLLAVLGTVAAVGRAEQFGHLTVVVLAVGAVAVPASTLLGRTVPSQGATAEAADDGDAGNRDLVEHVACDLRLRPDDVRLLTEAPADGVVRDADEVAEFFDGIRRKTMPMVSTVEELFRYCRATSTALRLEHSPLSLGEIISDAVAAEALIVRTAGVQVVARDHDRWPTVSGSFRRRRPGAPAGLRVTGPAPSPLPVERSRTGRPPMTQFSANDCKTRDVDRRERSMTVP